MWARIANAAATLPALRTQALAALHARPQYDQEHWLVVVGTDHGGRGKDPWGNERVGFTAKGAFDRGDFGLKWNQVLETGGVLVSDRVEIELEIQAVPQDAAVAPRSTASAPSIEAPHEQLRRMQVELDGRLRRRVAD